MNQAYLLERITKTKDLIVAYEDAILALSSGSVKSYSLDTGQSKQSVTKQDVAQLQTTLSSLENRLSILCTRANGSGTTYVKPGY